MTGAHENGIRFLTAIVCDDLRREDNGKELLIGVYSGSILVGAFPQVLVLCFWVPLMIPASGKYEFEFRMRNTDGGLVNQTPAIEVESLHANMDASIGLGQIPFHIPRAGNIILEGRYRRGGWEVIKSIAVDLRTTG